MEVSLSTCALMPGAYPPGTDTDYTPSWIDKRCNLPVEETSHIIGTGTGRAKSQLPMRPRYSEPTTLVSDHQNYECRPLQIRPEADENTNLLVSNEQLTNHGTIRFSQSAASVTQKPVVEACDRGKPDVSGQRVPPPTPLLSHDEISLNGESSPEMRDSHGQGIEHHITSVDRLEDMVRAGVTRRRRRTFVHHEARARLQLWFEGMVDFILIAVIGISTAFVAFIVNAAETFLFDLKTGRCQSGWYMSRKSCCNVQSSNTCHQWKPWFATLETPSDGQNTLISVLFGIACIFLACLGCSITLWSRVSYPFKNQAPGKLADTVNEWICENPLVLLKKQLEDTPDRKHQRSKPFFSTAGSGVAELKVIMSGFFVPGFLTSRALMLKTLALVPTVASGLSIGKEGPLIHIAACVGEVTCTIFSYLKINLDKRKKVEVVTMCAACGISLAFGSPFVGPFFTLEEFDRPFIPKDLIRAFLCSVVSTQTLGLLNPYGTGNALIFQTAYKSTWTYAELPFIILLGCLAGMMGAMLVKLNAFWTRTTQQSHVVQEWPLFEVMIVAALTGLLGFWNDYIRLPSVQLILELISPSMMSTEIAYDSSSDAVSTIFSLMITFALKAVLTIFSLGLKLPTGIYIPSMVLGGLLGRIIGYISQLVMLRRTNILHSVAPSGISQHPYALPGIYALIGAGALLTGATRLTATIIIALLAFSQNMEYMIPFCVAVLCAKWMANLVESRSFYDNIMRDKGYPYLGSDFQPASEDTIADIFQPFDQRYVLELSTSSVLYSGQLRTKLKCLDNTSTGDETMAIMRNSQFKGLIAVSDLLHELSQFPQTERKPCLLSVDSGWGVGDQCILEHLEVLDLTPLINETPVFLDIESPLELVHQCFWSLGCRCLCVSKNGQFVGVINKKDFTTKIANFR